MRKYLNTFNYKGKEYYIGTTVKLQGYFGDIAKLQKHYIDEKGTHRYEFVRFCDNSTLRVTNPDKVVVEIVENAETVPVPCNEDLYYKDTEVDAMFYGWVVYIFLMMVASIFYGRIGLWIIISCYFFKWRKKKLRKSADD